MCIAPKRTKSNELILYEMFQIHKILVQFNSIYYVHTLFLVKLWKQQYIRK